MILFNQSLRVSLDSLDLDFGRKGKDLLSDLLAIVSDCESKVNIRNS